VWSGNITRQPGFAGIEHRQPAGGLPGTDRVMDRALSLPIHHGLTSDDMGHMLGALEELFA
jgi:CDP-6-deoxy-D-xylo-4-hexulose-3-dehydrase